MILKSIKLIEHVSKKQLFWNPQKNILKWLTSVMIVIPIDFLIIILCNCP
jgi:1-acyl-sn-glycerol-3-phosphate acyltransferase